MMLKWSVPAATMPGAGYFIISSVTRTVRARYRDLVQALVMVELETLILAVANSYKFTGGMSKDYAKAVAVADALYGHSRIKMPYRLIVMGYWTEDRSMSARDWVELIAVGTIPLSVIVLFLNRWIKGYGLGVRASQFLAVATFPPIIIVLAMERIIDGSTVAALVGAFLGYLFSNISDFNRKRAEKKDMTVTK
jgi:hypothetical protein